MVSGDVLQSSIVQLEMLFLRSRSQTTPRRSPTLQAHEAGRWSNASPTTRWKNTIYQHEPEVAQMVDAPQSSFETVIQGMVNASRIGTARSYFGDYPFDVASKTGTPQTNESPNSTFFAFGPAEDPELAVCVVIEKGWHGYTGAPVAKKIFNQYFFGDANSVNDTNWGAAALKFCVDMLFYHFYALIRSIIRGKCDLLLKQSKDYMMPDIAIARQGRCGKSTVSAMLGYALANAE